MYSVYRLTERFGYRHVSDFLDDMPNGAELTGLFAYLNQDDEAQVFRTAFAIVKALGGGKEQAGSHDIDEDDEEVIDTTAPEFAEKFQGFINTKTQGQQMQRPMRQTSTQILMG